MSLKTSPLYLPSRRPATITRRSFMQTSLAACSATAVGLVSASRAATASPVKGGHFRFGFGHGSTTDVLDPGKVLNGLLSATHYAVTNTLTEVDTDGALIPKLATEWDATPDAKTWVFKLRQGVEFHDGKTLTVEDVIASINHHRGEGSTSSAKSIVNAITTLRADGTDRVVIELSGGDADFPFKLSSFNFPIYAAREDGSLAFEEGVGVGAYRLVNFEPGVRADFEKNPNYWNEARGHFDSAELISIKDVTARTNALRTGAVDAIDRVELKTANLLKETDGIVVHEVEGKTHYTFPMHTNAAPFNDRHVRMAVKLGLDREAMLKTILFGHGQIGNDTPINAAYPFFNAELEQRSYDPDKAKWHLKQAGHDSLDLTLSASDAAFAGAVDAAVLYKEQARDAGLNITVVREPTDGYWSDVWMKKPWCACYWPGYATPDSIFTQAYAAGASWNDTFWDNGRFNELLVAARSELDQTRRADLYGEMQTLVRDDGGTVVPFFANDVFAVSEKVGTGALSNNYEVDGRLFLERWWLNDA
ncbi:ABC transporter substrate-binding protein [Roseovarius faecimaris]|uniref:ABC transporter substrate-binding protein n=1 Tax=Roseovarius faecimaris TaxID=2494550 RepID=A0A6I6IPM4_9RHOB|nr:ABC transporter substrate-binding protein [Roseovarius faecimaris]QGX99100.1 ABC transporter substrate-binding protein [Roseovarius faecimaris]